MKRVTFGMKRTASGFTLIELMVVVGIIAIVAAIAYPSYQDSVRKSRRAEAKTALLDNAQRLERCFTAKATYVDCTTVSTGETANGYYTIAYSATATASTWELTATVQGVQATDTSCETFTLNEKGVKTAASENCW